MLRVRIAFAILIGLLAPGLLAQKTDEFGVPPMRVYPLRDMSGYSQAWTVVRDHRGLVYVGATGPDIHQLDGAGMRRIEGPSNIIRSMAVDKNGRIWVGSSADFGYLEPDKAGTLRYASLLDKVPEAERSFNDIWLTVTSKGVFFRSLVRLFRWDGTRMKTWSASGSLFEGVGESHGKIWVSRAGIGLQELVGDELRDAPGGEVFAKSTRVYTLAWDNGKSLIARRNEMLALYDGKSLTPFPTAADAYLRENEAYYTVLLSDGAICVATIRGGIAIIERDGRLRRIYDQNSGLPGAGVYSVFEDREGALWLGSGASVVRIDMRSPVSLVASSRFGDAAPFQGILYGATGSGGAGLHIFERDRKSGIHIPRALAGPVTQGFKLTIFRDPSVGGRDQLLAATGNGPMRIDGDRVTPLVAEFSGFVASTYEVFQSRKEPTRVFLGLARGGIASMRWDGRRWNKESHVSSAVAVRRIEEDGDGNVWGGTQNEVVRYEIGANGLDPNKARTFSRADGAPRGSLVPRWIDGEIWVSSAAAAGTFRFDRAAQKFVRDDRFYLALPDARSATALWQHPNGEVWSITSSGNEHRTAIFRKDASGKWQGDEEPVRALAATGFNNLSADGDHVWASGTEGVLRFHTKQQAGSSKSYKTLIRAVRPFGGDAVYGGDGSSGAAPQIEFARNSLRFEFAAPIFGNESRTQYQFFLEGADRDWRDWSTQRDANYNGLAPGSYRFRVRARGMEGQLAEEAVYAFEIQPPWYRSNLAYLCYGALLLLAGAGARRAVARHEQEKARKRTETLEAQARELEASVEARTREIAEQKERIEHAYETVELLSDIGKEITASLDLDTILFRLYERVNQLADANIFGVGLYRPEKHLIEYTLAIENGKRYTPYTRDTRDKNQFAVWCLENRKPVLLNDVETEYSKYISRYDGAKGVLEDGSKAQNPHSMIYLPLVAQDRVLGVISVQSFRKNAYTEQHIGLLENLAAYTTIALDNASAYRQVGARAAELATINRITQALAEKLDMESVIQLVGDQVRDLFHAPVVYVALLDHSSMTIRFPYAYGETAEPIPYGEGLTSKIIRTGKPLRINGDVEATSEALGVRRMGRQAESFLGVPIPVAGENIGVISVQSTDGRESFTEAQERLLSTIASAVGVAIHNARLFEETRQARAAAEEADAAKSSFLSTVSHELRTPLTSVLGFAKIIRRRLEDRLLPLIPAGEKKTDQAKAQVLENLGVVVSEGERLTKLIDDVLDLAKIEAGRFTWNMEPSNLGDIIERAVAATSSLFEGKKVKLERDVDPILPAITGDRDRLMQVVINLISNAVKFTPEGTVRIAAHARDGNAITVSVTDSGIGIAPGDHQKVFEKFKQVGDTLTDKPRGTGLGLPICKEIVEHHGGRIWVESALGRGSTFAFTLPVQAGTETAARPLSLDTLVRQLRERVASQQPKGRSILVVDDDPSIRSLLEQEFTEAGYTVRLAADGREALQRVREEKPGLVVLDVMMPEMNGFDVAAVLKNDPATMEIPIIILSIVDDKERGFRIGVDRYLTKPIDTEALFHEAGDLLEQGTSHRKVMIVDEDASAVRTLTQVLEAGGYHVVESNGADLMVRATEAKPDIIILNSVLSNREETVRSLRFEKGLENVLFLIYHQ